jgi:hypothetical protein
MRRFASSCVPVSVVALARRFYTPPADLTKLYQSDFDLQAFPTAVVPSDSTLFAKFLFKAAEQNNNFDVVLKDFQTIATVSKKLPVFWQRSVELDSVAEFKQLAPSTLFTLHWMRSNDLLELIPQVSEVFETFVNAKNKKVVARVFVNPAATGDQALLAKAKDVAAKLLAGNAALKGYTLVVNAVADADIKSGFAVDVAGAYHSEAKGDEVATGAGAAREVDYTAVPLPKALKTKWDDSAETEVLSKYFESLAKYDAEEAKIGA